MQFVFTLTISHIIQDSSLVFYFDSVIGVNFEVHERFRSFFSLLIVLSFLLTFFIILSNDIFSWLFDFTFRSFVPPVRDEESETQRKAHAKRVRETRRSTQG